MNFAPTRRRHKRKEEKNNAPLSAPVVIVARDTHVVEAGGARGGEHGVERGECAPVGEEVSCGWAG
jgi:hypothetical protein